MTSRSPTLRHEDYSIAWIAILPIEVDAALAALDNKHDGVFPSARGDDYTYIGGEIEGHNVVIAKLPAGQQYGVVTAAALVNQVKIRFENIWFALLVGVAAGLPDYDVSSNPKRRDIRLGDVIVCVPDKHSAGVLHYDIGQDTESGFQINSRQAEPPSLVRAAIGDIQHIQRPFRRGNPLALLLHKLQASSEHDEFRYPGQDQDTLYRRQFTEDGRHTDTKVDRTQRDELERTRVWYGRIGSGNSLMRSAIRKDELRERYDLLGLEMEAAGVMNTLPTGVIRGVCDYGDGHKAKNWQAYAAAVAATYAKALLLQMRPRLGNVSSSE